MQKKPLSIRYGEYMGHVAVRHNKVSFNDITRHHAPVGDTAERTYALLKVKLLPRDVYRLLAPYVSARFVEQLKNVAPLGLYLAMFQLLALAVQINEPWIILGGFLSVVAGLACFMEGIKVGLMPLAETLGDRLPAKSSLPVVLIITFILGVGVTFAEPAIGALQMAGKSADPVRAALLSELLGQWRWPLVLVIGLGVGVAAVVGALRFIYGWSLKPIIYISLLPTALLTAYAMTDEQLEKAVGLAWDCGAITTGPITVPLVLAMGIGIASAAGKGDEPLSGFGVVTMASIFPVFGVLALAYYVHWQSPGMLPAYAIEPALAPNMVPWHETPPFADMVAGLRAVAPVAVFLYLVLRLVVRERIKRANIVIYGITLCLVGMALFNVGLTFGLTRLGEQSGSIAPAAFESIKGVAGSPLFSWWVGVPVALAFTAILGFGATMAEPALAATGMTVENLTNGAYKKTFLIYSVSAGVGAGMALGIAKTVFALKLGWLLLPAYAMAVALTYFSSEEFVNIAWDCAGVTTGPVTVPLALALGLGFGGAVGASEGFGILALASAGPVISVLATGLWIKWKIRMSHK
ncbi:MAG: DUF1538 domain-containing protein [Nitrospinae bacterium]|nr:DUF1538 domain-containing protein [Nitrospinota bacterium]